MNMPDDPVLHQAVVNDEAAVGETAPAEQTEERVPVSPTTAQPSGEDSPLPEEPRRFLLADRASARSRAFEVLAPLLERVRLRPRLSRKDRLYDWQHWSKFRLWRHTRPLWGSILMISASLIMMGSAAFFLPLAFLTQALWPVFLIGGLLFMMGTLQLFLPSYAVMTGAIGMVLALTSLLVASFGGCGLGLLLGVVGSTLSIAWRPVKRSRLLAATSRPS